MARAVGATQRVEGSIPKMWLVLDEGLRWGEVMWSGGEPVGSVPVVGNIAPPLSMVLLRSSDDADYGWAVDADSTRALWYEDEDSLLHIIQSDVLGDITAHCGRTYLYPFIFKEQEVATTFWMLPKQRACNTCLDADRPRIDIV